MQKQHYIIITPFFPTEENFVGPFIYDQARAIIKEGTFDVSILKIIHTGNADAYVYQGVKVYPLKIKDLPSFLFPGLFLNTSIKTVINKLLEITNHNLKEISFIHGHVTYASGILSVAVANKIKAKSIVQHHGLDVMGYTNGRFQNRVMKKINSFWINKIHVQYLNQATWNVGVSKKTLNQLHKIQGYITTKEYVLYNGVDTTKFHKLEGIKDKRFFTVGCVGNFLENKRSNYFD